MLKELSERETFFNIKNTLQKSAVLQYNSGIPAASIIPQN